MTNHGLLWSPRTLLVLLLTMLGGASAAQKRIDVPTRVGVVQPVYLTTAHAPQTSVILFPGGSGVVAAVRNKLPAACGSALRRARHDGGSD